MVLRFCCVGLLKAFKERSDLIIETVEDAYGVVGRVVRGRPMRRDLLSMSREQEMGVSQPRVALCCPWTTGGAQHRRLNEC